MARTPKPWFWKERQCWLVTIRGESKNLGPDKKEAIQAFHEMMSKPPKKPLLRGNSVVAIIDLFLDATQKHNAPDTYAWYQQRLQVFVRRHPDLTVDLVDLQFDVGQTGQVAENAHAALQLFHFAADARDFFKDTCLRHFIPSHC